MKDLRISYVNENEETMKREYNTIIDFINEMESDSIEVGKILIYQNRKDAIISASSWLKIAIKVGQSHIGC